MIRLAVFDIDGTLVPRSTHVPAAQTLAAIRELKDKGILTAAATGRQYMTIQPEIREACFDYFICANGSCITDHDGKPIHVRTFDRGTVLTLSEVMRQLKKPLLYRYLEGSRESDPLIPFGTYGKGFFSAEQLWKMQEAPKPVIPKDEFPYAGLCHIESDDLVFLRDRFPQLKFTVTAGGELCDINRKDTDKAAGIRILAGIFGILREEVLACGDDMNDLEMIRWAGIGVAMGNAEAEVREAASHITDTCEGLGVRKALQYFGLIGGENEHG